MSQSSTFPSRPMAATVQRSRLASHFFFLGSTGSGTMPRAALRSASSVSAVAMYLAQQHFGSYTNILLMISYRPCYRPIAACRGP